MPLSFWRVDRWCDNGDGSRGPSMGTEVRTGRLRFRL